MATVKSKTLKKMKPDFCMIVPDLRGRAGGRRLVCVRSVGRKIVKLALYVGGNTFQMSRKEWDLKPKQPMVRIKGEWVIKQDPNPTPIKPTLIKRKAS